ncbi:MAG: family 20 glycosylhydrolase [Eubacteriales bacterium]
MKLTNLSILPTPKEVSGADKDGNFAFAEIMPFVYTAKPDWFDIMDAFAGYAEKTLGIAFENKPGAVELVFDHRMKKEHYQLDVTEGVKLYACDISGIGYALSTLLQIISVENGKIVVPATVINDYPDCSFRTLMVDLARQWHTFENILDYVDLCFLYKANYLHLHFIDSQSYTLPSRIFPKLPTDGRHYTREQIAQLVAYAKARNITLIPEFEAPGHSSAMLNSYPELFACGDGSVNKNIICAGKPEVYSNLDKIFGEICEMFPYSPYIHIGGDEADIEVWNDCEDCRSYMEREGISSVKALYTDFIVHMTNIVFAHNRTPIVWEGFPKEGSEKVSRDVVVISWENYYHYTPDLLAEGFNIINASWQPLYIIPSNRWTPYDILNWNVYNWQHFWVNSIAHLNPIHVQPTEKVMGAQLCAWECTYEQDIQPVKEKLPALCERTWSVKRYLEDAEFGDRLKKVLTVADAIIR